MLSSWQLQLPTCPRDNEVFGIVKELGAEDRTIGLLTKCDLAQEKRWRLDDKIGNGLRNATSEDQEKTGFVPLKRGFYGMICRDTEEAGRTAEAEQTSEAIQRVKVQERERPLIRLSMIMMQGKDVVLTMCTKRSVNFSQSTFKTHGGHQP